MFADLSWAPCNLLVKGLLDRAESLVASENVCECEGVCVRARCWTLWSELAKMMRQGTLLIGKQFCPSRPVTCETLVQPPQSP